MTRMFAIQFQFDNVWNNVFRPKYGEANYIFAQDLWVYVECCKTVASFYKEYKEYIERALETYCENDGETLFKLYLSHKIVFQNWYNLNVKKYFNGNPMISNMYDKMLEIETYLLDKIEELDEEQQEIFSFMYSYL